MPPTAAARKVQPAPDPTRRQSVRQARTSSTRPQNYYARPFGSFGGPVEGPADEDPPGFFPAIQYFTDSIDALPKEVMRYVTMVKEVEAKIHGPTQALARLSDTIMKMPVPPRRHPRPTAQTMLSFTGPNSATTSHNGSVINGALPTLHHQNTSDSLDPSAATPQIDEQADLTRRHAFQELRFVVSNMIANLDEKNVVMAQANRCLAQQLDRVDHVLPYVENEISEEARLGSLTHWAYADNRVKKQAAPTVHERTRRDVAATNNLAAAAAAMHDADIAAARNDARREAKKSRKEQIESDFDDKPVAKKPGPGKGRKAAETAPAAKATGLGITNGTVNELPAKKRRIEKPLAAPAMERQLSGLRNGRGGKASPRSTPAAETIKKKTKAAAATAPAPAPAPALGPGRKRNQGVGSGHNSPIPASSPLVGPVAMIRENSTQRPTSSRARQNSSTLLQNTLLADRDKSRPASVADNRSANGSAGDATDIQPAETASHRGQKTRDIAQDDSMDVDAAPVHLPPEADAQAGTLKHEETVEEAAAAPSVVTNSRSGRASKLSTPRTDSFPSDLAMVRTRSGRGNNAANTRPGTTSSSTSDQPLAQSRSSNKGHRKSASGAHILKQIASYNRSPVMSRDHDPDDDMSELGSDTSEPQAHSRDVSTTGISTRRNGAPGSRATSARQSTAREGRGRGTGEKEATAAASHRKAERTPPPEPVPDAVDEEPGYGGDDDEMEEEDPNEPKYCYCGKGSFGEMIACDNESCEREWFHLGCVGLATPPDDNVKWYCRDCDPNNGKKKRARPGSRHQG